MNILKLWGKIEDDVFHPAVFHMLDVGYVCMALLSSASPRWRTIMAKQFGPETLTCFLPYMIAMHDIGKISAPFQAQEEIQRARVVKEGFNLNGWEGNRDLYHPVISQIHIRKMAGLEERLVSVWGDAVGGHHGFYQSRVMIAKSTFNLQRWESPEWEQHRQEADRILREVFIGDNDLKFPTIENISTGTVLLTGLMILCDWIGSNELFFPPEPDVALSDYVGVSKSRANKAVRELGFNAPIFSTKPATFKSLFPDKPARPLQKSVSRIPAEVLTKPSLIVIESPTGEGKTEAALLLAHRIAQHKNTDEFYIAMPTTATTDQMYLRVSEFISSGLQLRAPRTLLHGQKITSDTAQVIRTSRNTEMDEARYRFFAPNKKGMVAPFGIGTVDQAELSVLNARYSMLRLLGLAGKVIIFDEVHAYDTYMNTIIHSLLKWLSMLDTTVIVLSATLPQRQKSKMIESYCGNVDNTSTYYPYPSIHVVSKEAGWIGSHLPYQGGKDIEIGLISHGRAYSDSKAKFLLSQVSGDKEGCACWIVNTVAEAQEIYAAVLKEIEATEEEIDTTLLHARFPLDERRRIEKKVVSQFGPDSGTRPQRAIVVGTQILEQSLDLDFDVMISEIAPIDLLLQRAGRLHRHERNRPASHSTPRFFVNVERTDESPSFGLNSLIYHPYLLLLTWHQLSTITQFSLPEDYRILIESVYGDVELTEEQNELLNKLKAIESYETTEAELRLIPEPDPDWEYGYRSAQVALREKDAADESWYIAKTRLGRPSVSLIPLQRTEGRVFIWNTDIELSGKLSFETQKEMLRRFVKIDNDDVVNFIKEQDVHHLFEDAVLLEGYHPLWLSREGKAMIPVIGDLSKHRVVTVDEKLGILISKRVSQY